MAWPVAIASLLLLSVAAIVALRLIDSIADRNASRELLRLAGGATRRFDVDMLNGLPEPARRYFMYTITPGTPLLSVVEIDMAGELGLGSREKPGYRPMFARQILAPPYGLVWRVQAGSLRGSDGITPNTSWTRFWLFGLIPVVRIARQADHHRSAFGRVVAEGAFWAPAALLTSDNVTWQAPDRDTARATVRFRRFTQAVDITISPEGQPSRVIIRRWSNENRQRIFREQPFGGFLADYRDFGGYRLPTRVEGGNHIGTDAYFPFYRATVKSFRFPQRDD